MRKASEKPNSTVKHDVKNGRDSVAKTAKEPTGHVVRDARTGRFISVRQAALERIMQRREELPPLTEDVGDLVRRSRGESA